MVKVTGAPRRLGKERTYDIEVNGGDNPTNTYLIQMNNKCVVSHNTVSLLAGITPGIHWPISRCYIRRIRLGKNSHLIGALKDAGFKIEDCIGSEKTTCVVEFPVMMPKGTRSQKEVSMWEKLSLAKFMQEHWSDNQVSVTIDFDKEKEGDQIKHALDYFQYGLKSISFLPRLETGNTVYPQMPYEEISEEQCARMLSEIKPLNFDGVSTAEEEVERDMFCDSDVCQARE